LEKKEIFKNKKGAMCRRGGIHGYGR